MKNICFFILFAISPIYTYGFINNSDSLLKVLDTTISHRAKYTKAREDKIKELKKQKSFSKTNKERHDINTEIIGQYNSFICDSAEFYVNENLAIAQKMNNEELILEAKLNLSYVYSLSGLFTQAVAILDSLNYDNLPQHLKALCCWNSIRYYENLINYVDDKKFTKIYTEKIQGYRDEVMSILYTQSDEYRKELAFKLQQEGKFNESIELLTPIFKKQEPGTHGYAMAAMSLAKVYKAEKKYEEEKYYLILAAITDITLAVKENEALLSLAINLYDKGDIDRAYNYIKVALDDALYYNARFKNSVIARVQPIIEDTYLKKIEEQKANLRLYAILISLFVVILAIALYYNYIHFVAVSKAKKELRHVNEKLLNINQKLDEANIVKEKYIGYFMNQCAIYINKLDDYRKTVNRKIKTGQVDSLHKSSSSELEKEIEELCNNFDKAFLKLFPNYIEEFNSLLKPQNRYQQEGGSLLNTELRIFALIRLGITDVSQIAIFLRYSVQTVYNYKSKVKGKALIDSDQFEEEIKKIGSLY